MKKNIMKALLAIFLSFIFATSASGQTDNNESKTIHVFVALCDNTYQGIVPVPAAIGNGQNPATNLYWGCAYGISTFFKKSKDWRLVATHKASGVILERLIFKHTTKDYYLIADAYDGQYIKQCIHDFLGSSCGNQKETLTLDGKKLNIGGNASLVAYVGHNGLMDFTLSDTYTNTDGMTRDVIILACYSKQFFSPHMQTAKADPLLWATHLMCPEAYTLHDAIAGYIDGKTSAIIREKAAAAYARYQKCSIKAAKRLLTTGW